MERVSAKQYCIDHGMTQLLEECSITENESLNMDEISYASHKQIWWRCSMGHQWKSAICDRLMKDNGCPYCANKKVLPGYNDLASKYPKLAKEWHPTRNNGLTPDQVIPGSDKVVWWQCELGHEWRASIENRALKEHSCPFCTGKRAWPGFNDLNTLHPDLMKEWHPTFNGDLDPTQLRPASRKRAWWKCDEGHVWEAYIFNRTSSAKSGCPLCAGNQKKSKNAEWIARAQKREEELKRIAEAKSKAGDLVNVDVPGVKKIVPGDRRTVVASNRKKEVVK